PRLIFCRLEEPFVFTEDGDDEGNEVSPLQVVYLDSIDFGDRQVLGGMPQIAVWKHDMIKLYSEKSKGKMINLMNIFFDGWVTLTPCEVNYLGLRYGACDRLLYVVTDGVVEFDKIYRIIRVVEEITGSSKFKVCRDHAGNYFVSCESLIDAYKFDHAALSVSK
ncbi:hypothetical protein U9M48_015549, partial [Paspalum notatum var. saurae]